MEKFVPCLWFDQNAEEAVQFYTGLFPDARVGAANHYLAGADYAGAPPMPPGTVMDIRFTLCGQEFAALNGGPIFRFNPAISLYVACPDAAGFDALWAALSEGGSVLMEAGEYPFSPKFGWLADRFGLSWQLAVEERSQAITPYLLFVGAAYGRAEEAMDFYASVFGRGEIRSLQKVGPGDEAAGTVQFATFSLHGQTFMVADSGYPHGFFFNEAVSFIVYCEDQAEIDRLWAKLTADGGQEQSCGWVKDKFGVSWQVVAREVEALTADDDPARAARVIPVLFRMTKIDIAALRAAAGG